MSVLKISNPMQQFQIIWRAKNISVTAYFLHSRKSADEGSKMVRAALRENVVSYRTCKK